MKVKLLICSQNLEEIELYDSVLHTNFCEIIFFLFFFSGREYFVCDFKGHCVVVFNEAGIFLRRIGCESITSFPNGIDISDAGDILVGDSHGNRFHIAVFTRDGNVTCEFECPYVKVRFINQSSLFLNVL